VRLDLPRFPRNQQSSIINQQFLSCANLPAMADVTSCLSNRTKQFLSDKVSEFTESVIREMTRQAMLYGAVNLAQGFPDFAAPAEQQLAWRGLSVSAGNYS
jgi:hypothetical protein